MIAMQRTTLTLLLADDDANLLTTLGDYLESKGFTVLRANGGRSALKIAASERPDLILLDIAMPDMGGVAVLKELRANPDLSAIPVLVLTARLSMEPFFDGIGVQGFLSKPCEEEDIANAITRILGSAPPSQSDTRRTNGSLHVYVIDDDADLATHLAREFEHAGHKVTVMNKAGEAIEASMQHTPDVFVVREILPGLNGSVVASLLADLPHGRQVPFILYDDTASEYGSTTRQHRYMEHLPRGVTRFFSSPNASAIVAAAEEICGIKSPVAR